MALDKNKDTSEESFSLHHHLALNILRLEYTKHIDTNDILDIMHAPNLDHSPALDSLEMSDLFD